ncbi:FabD/lysophospholipase-like protein [Annulohypoxylon nitens]|nr:FabD/lysophospholipase-like protein [Annulohypoxylon nitens]
MSNKPSPLKLLSIDGGGVRGLASLIIIKHLMKRVNPDNPPKPCEYFDLIGGTSTGGIIALMLGRLQMDVQTCIDKYCELSAAIFELRRSNLDLLRRGKDKWNLKGKYRSQALEKSIRNVVEERLGDSQAKMFDSESSCKVFVCTFTKSFNTPVLIQSYKTAGNVDTQALLDCKIWEAARATSAAATFFDPITIGRQTFVDGATGNNNPIRQVLDEAKLIWPDAVERGRIQCLVSVGTGVLSLGDFGGNLKELVLTLRRIATDTEETEKRFYKDHKDLGIGNKYFRFNVDRGLSDVALGAFERIDVIETATENYLRNDRVKELVETFVSSKASMLCTYPS